MPSQRDVRLAKMYAAVARGLCFCGREKRVPGGSQGQNCRDRSARNSKSRRRDRKKKGLCTQCGRNSPRPRLTQCSSCVIATEGSRTRWKDRLRLEVFNRYGGPQCRCCGESIIQFLTIDHIRGEGGQHRCIDRSATSILSWLRDRNFPSGYRVLCMNCNWSTRFGNPCPHRKLKRRVSA